LRNNSSMTPRCCEVGHIPVIAQTCLRLGLIDLINESIPCNTDVDLGTLVTGMVCDTLFISRFSANFIEHDRVIGQAIDAGQWEELSVLAETPSPKKWNSEKTLLADSS
jgi:hypothetical protein